MYKFIINSCEESVVDTGLAKFRTCVVLWVVYSLKQVYAAGVHATMFKNRQCNFSGRFYTDEMDFHQLKVDIINELSVQVFVSLKNSNYANC